MPPREWDAATYDRVAAPQETWGRDVLERLDLRGDERVLDAGCGTGRVTALLLERVPHGRVVAVDGSEAMVAETRRRLGDRVEAFAVDLLDLELDAPVDAILSTATFHWIADHDRLFARLHAALKPGGQLAAQCGGAGNVANVVEAIDRVGPPARGAGAGCAPCGGAAPGGGGGAPGPWHFAGARETAQRLRAAGFADVWTWLQPWPVTPEDPRAFFATAILGAHLDRLPEGDREPFIDAVMAEVGEPVVARYVRLNLLARRP
jgi:trans-aconitate 2-methyltransferase